MKPMGEFAKRLPKGLGSRLTLMDLAVPIDLLFTGSAVEWIHQPCQYKCNISGSEND